MVDPADVPMGKWHEAIEHLAAASALMGEMSSPSPDREDFTLEQVYRALFNSATRAIQHHWRYSYFEQANKLPKARVDANGHMKFIDDEPKR